MTNEEAIKQIDGAEVILRNRDFLRYQTACIMAINALRAQQEQTPCYLCKYGGKHLDSPPCEFCPACPKADDE